MWNAIDANAPDRFKEIATRIDNNLLSDWGVVEDIDFRKQLIEPLADLLELIREIKNQQVYFLQISAYTTAWSQQEYNEAIVTVFTRLNTAGRALKQEEITMAWLKVGWKPEHTDDKTAVECLENLRVALSPIWSAENEEEVRLISYFWAIFYHESNLIDAKDMLNGQIMQPMASQISQDWKPFLKSIEEASSLIEDRKLSEVFSSFNAVIVSCSVFYLYYRWQQEHLSSWSCLGQRDQENYNKQIEEIFNPFLDRWILCSQWAGNLGKQFWSGFSELC